MIQAAGIIDRAEAAMLCEAGVDWLGFPLRLPSKREDLTEAEAIDVIASIRSPHKGVVITYLTEAEEIRAFCAELGVRTVQLHGDVPAAQLRTLKQIDPELYVLKSLVVEKDNTASLARTVEEVADWVDMFITDSFNPATGAKGATGMVHDWRVSAKLARLSPRPLMLAGGLNADNVIDAIEQVRPAAVDAHTGLEGPDGRKDPEKVRLFVERSKLAFARLALGVVAR
ncbi:phosphoribosylanthranilate isomerase [Rhizocola hellebori]|uniref:phosphoribosylanthranilate isomerase n=1 Tax=Rhizocola hellebori TaxID=1392758 RepID=UPI0019428417|nr:phosphoribosylanthranilate isomerase [Rhizocola hellebori]